MLTYPCNFGVQAKYEVEVHADGWYAEICFISPIRIIAPGV